MREAGHRDVIVVDLQNSNRDMLESMFQLSRSYRPDIYRKAPIRGALNTPPDLIFLA